jgi:hypothetical protein
MIVDTLWRWPVRDRIDLHCTEAIHRLLKLALQSTLKSLSSTGSDCPCDGTAELYEAPQPGAPRNTAYTLAQR